MCMVDNPLVNVAVTSVYTIRMRKNDAIRLGYTIVETEGVKKTSTVKTKKVKAAKNKSVLGE